jgi:hypothetical protein
MLHDAEPDIDERTLCDTVDGLTDLNEMLAATVRAALEDETLVGMLKVRMAEMRDRAERFERRAERRRQIVRDAMVEAGIKRLMQPDFTVVVQRAAPHVVVVDEALIPEEYFETRKQLRKADVARDLKQGNAIAGAALSNPPLAIRITTR